MPSLDFEAEKAAFRDYYDNNLARLDRAKTIAIFGRGSREQQERCSPAPTQSHAS
jgi:hypothetical protein